MPTEKARVCIIGAGPCGMSALIHLTSLGLDKDSDVVCYEKQSTWGGMWNYTWRTGTDEFGEPCPNGMYKHLFVNSAKEFHEYPDYTFDQHFGKPIPSYPPRHIIRQYLEGRYKQKRNLSKYVKFNTVVRYVQYDKKTDKFTVETVNMATDTASSETFTHVIVAVGIFNVPNQPAFPGAENFEGPIIHAHNFRCASTFKGLRVLVVGASYSAEDIALQCMKFGAKNVVCSWRTKPMNHKWPKGIEERPLLQRLDKNVAYFKDGTSAEVDAVILCTGYLYDFPFMADDLRLKSTLSLYPENLYKGVLWLGGGNNRVFYLGTQNQIYSFVMFDVQALWTSKYILGKLPNEPHKLPEMKADAKKWRERCDSLTELNPMVDFQTDYIADLGKDTGYSKEVLKSRSGIKTWAEQRTANILTYKDQCFPSNITGTVSAKPRKSVWEELDDENCVKV